MIARHRPRQPARHVTVDERVRAASRRPARQIGEADLAAGLTPFFVTANVGTTSSNAMDPVRAIGAICREYGLWLHVDAAMAATATVCPSLLTKTGWVDRQLLLQPPQVDVHQLRLRLLLRSRPSAALVNTLSVVPEYLRNAASGCGCGHRLPGLAGVPGTAALRAETLVCHPARYGVEEAQHHIRRHVALARKFRRWVEDDPNFELLAPAPLSLVCFRHVGGGAVSAAIVDRVNRDGRIFITRTKLNDVYTIHGDRPLPRAGARAKTPGRSSGQRRTRWCRSRRRTWHDRHDPLPTWTAPSSTTATRSCRRCWPRGATRAATTQSTRRWPGRSTTSTTTLRRRRSRVG
ncbi:MAG: pyridoxal-dependent decarboxylase [Caldilineaceae bacterium]